MNETLVDQIARSLYFSNANIMFGWQGWAYKQASEWRRLHDLWATMPDSEKSIWLNRARELLDDIRKTKPNLHEFLINGQLADNGNRWWVD